jgi:anti-sigma regulatory factor (Ser/Thr protein kinase)
MRTDPTGYEPAIDYRFHLPAVASSASEARRVTRSALEEWGLSRLDDTVSLLVTELVSNGVRHARTLLELLLSYDGTCLRIGVSDRDPRPPVTRPRQKFTVGGWGLTLVESLSTNWGTDIDETSGKTVWFEIDTTTLDPANRTDPTGLNQLG